MPDASYGCMRIRTLVLAGIATLGPLAFSLPSFAEPTPLKHVVGQALSATQAVLLDEDTGEYRIVRMGDEVNGARVVAIGAEEVVLIQGGTKELLRLAPDPRPRPKVMMEPLVVNIRPVAAPAPAAWPSPSPLPSPPPSPSPLPSPLPLRWPPPSPSPSPLPSPCPREPQPRLRSLRR